jgi:hypothetical protein
MESIGDLIASIQTSWGQGATACHRNVVLPFQLKCLFFPGLEQQDFFDELNKLPVDFRAFLAVSNGASLFKDEQYGQWGLELFDFSECVRATDFFQKERAKDKKAGDLIIGRFLGDSDYLLLRCDSTSSDFGYIVVVNALDVRDDWYSVATNFFDFVKKFSEKQGDKYWEA